MMSNSEIIVAGTLLLLFLPLVPPAFQGTALSHTSLLSDNHRKTSSLQMLFISFRQQEASIHSDQETFLGNAKVL